MMCTSVDRDAKCCCALFYLFRLVHLNPPKIFFQKHIKHPPSLDVHYHTAGEPSEHHRTEAQGEASRVPGLSPPTCQKVVVQVLPWRRGVVRIQGEHKVVVQLQRRRRKEN